MLDGHASGETVLAAGGIHQSLENSSANLSAAATRTRHATGDARKQLDEQLIAVSESSTGDGKGS